MRESTEKFSDPSEGRFAKLLEQRRHRYWTEKQLEQKIVVRAKRPDFFVQPSKGPGFLAEVKSFKKQRALIYPPLGTGIQMSVGPLLDPIRCAVEEAADQFSPYREDKMPTLLVLDNWRLMGIPSGIEYLRDALMGDPELRLVASKGKIGPWTAHRGRGQILHPSRKQYISAVAWNMPKLRFTVEDTEAPMRLRVMHNPFALEKLPLEIFSGDEDEHWGYDDRGCWARFA